MKKSIVYGLAPVVILGGILISMFVYQRSNLAIRNLINLVKFHNNQDEVDTSLDEASNKNIETTSTSTSTFVSVTNQVTNDSELKNKIQATDQSDWELAYLPLYKTTKNLYVKYPAGFTSRLIENNSNTAINMIKVLKLSNKDKKIYISISWSKYICKDEYQDECRKTKVIYNGKYGSSKKYVMDFEDQKIYRIKTSSNKYMYVQSVVPSDVKCDGLGKTEVYATCFSPFFYKYITISVNIQSDTDIDLVDEIIRTLYIK